MTSDDTQAASSSSLGRWLLWGIAAMLCMFGVCFIYSTGYIGDQFPVRPNWIRQLLWIGCGVVGAAFVGTSRPWTLRWKLFIWSGYALSVLLLLIVLFCGTSIGGARRWLAIGPLMLQPAEFAKFFTLMAVCEAMNGTALSKFAKWLAVPLLAAVPFWLILISPSFGNAFSILPSLLCMAGFAWTGRRSWKVLCIITIAAIFGSFAFILCVRSASTDETAHEPSAIGRLFLKSYHSRRLQSYLTPQGGWNERQSMMTLGSGGAMGKGFLQGTMKSLGYLPRTVAPTDFIFSVIGEELGFFRGCLPVLALYTMLFCLGLHWSAHAQDESVCMRCIAVIMMLATHVFVNVAMTVRLLPVMGLPLPFLSYGGSFILTSFFCLGVIHATSQLRDKRPSDFKDSRNEWTLGRLFRIRIRSLR